MKQERELSDSEEATGLQASYDPDRRSFMEHAGGLLLGGLFATMAGAQLGHAQEATSNGNPGGAVGFYELRVYTCVPGKRDELAKRFVTGGTAAVYARHGITNVGYFIPQQSDSELGISAENTFIYIRGYPSKEERDKRLKAAHADPEFRKVVIDVEMNPATKTILKAHNIDMEPIGMYNAITITK